MPLSWLWTLIKRTSKPAKAKKPTAKKKAASKPTAKKASPAPRSGAVAKPRRAATPKPATVAA